MRSELRGISDRLDLQRDLLEKTKTAAENAEGASDAAKSASSNVKWNIFFTALGVIGVVFVVYQVWMQAIEMTTGIVK